MDNNLPDYDVAIIGGGASGIYTAWRMLLEGTEYSEKLKKWKEERGSLKIAIFEGSHRTGGRILSAKAPGMPDVVCEIGGMRFVSSQTLVQGLVLNKLKLPVHEQTVDDPKNIAMLRGKYLRVSQLSDPAVLPYQFTDDEKAWLAKDGNVASNFLDYSIRKAIPDITQHLGEGLRGYLTDLEVNGVPLYEQGFWNVIAPQLSHEAYRIAVTTIGYDCLGFNTNAVDVICEYYDFTPGVKYYLLDDGYDAVFWNMQRQFIQHGGEVKINKWLQSFDETILADGTKGVALQFKGESETYSARAIILAMPKRSINLLDEKGPVLSPAAAPHVQPLLNSVSPIHLYKMFIAYKEPWWEKEGVTIGRSLTDIPIRQCYYWGVETKKQDTDTNNTNAILMVYNDGLSSDFWGGLRHIPLGPDDTKDENSPLAFKRKTSLLHTSTKQTNEWDKRLNANWKRCVAPKAMVAEMHRQLMVLHNITDAPEPLEAAFVDWGDDPYGGAVHFWNPGYKSSEILESMIQPVNDFPCYVCGEAYSTNQTWVEGAFQTAELVLRKFDIPEPKWLTANE